MGQKVKDDMATAGERLIDRGRDEDLIGLIKGIIEGLIEEAARVVLTTLRVRGIDIPEAARERILAERHLARLERWHEKAIVAASVDEVLDEPS